MVTPLLLSVILSLCFYTYVGLVSPECTMMKTCGPYIVVEHNGDVYSCDFFVEPKWKLGNIKTGKMINMLNSKKQAQFALAKAQLPIDCRKCTWLRHCLWRNVLRIVLKIRKIIASQGSVSRIRCFLHMPMELFRTWQRSGIKSRQHIERAQNMGGVYNAFDDFMKE